MFSQTERHTLRAVYFEIWRKYKQGIRLDIHEKSVLSIIELHPEYHHILDSSKNIENDYLPEFGETNPFLHMSLHLSLREQISTNRPQGIGKIFQKILLHEPSQHHAEHIVMECLADTLWLAQKQRKLVDEKNYLKKLKKILQSY